MPYTMEDFQRDVALEQFEGFTDRELVENIPKDRLRELKRVIDACLAESNAEEKKSAMCASEIEARVEAREISVSE